MDGGNLTEEYTNLPTLLALYMALRVFGQEKIGEKLFLPAAGMGVCAAAAFSLRANNALPIFALVAVLAAGLAITQRFAQLGQCAAGFTLGLLAVFLPILILAGRQGRAFRRMVRRDHPQHDVRRQRHGRPFCRAVYHVLRPHGDDCRSVCLCGRARRLEKAPRASARFGDAGGGGRRRAGRVPFPQILHPLPDARRARWPP